MSELITSEVYRPQVDLGTPTPVQTGNMVSIQLDGKAVEVAEGTSILRADNEYFPCRHGR